MSFLQERVRTLATTSVERLQLLAASSAAVDLASVTRIAPNPMVLDAASQPIPLGAINGGEPGRLMLEFLLKTGAAEPGPFFVGRVDISGEVLGARQRAERVVLDLSVEVQADVPKQEPPAELLDALSRLSLYRLQSRAQDALQKGDVAEATRKLEYLATRLFENGAEELGKAALHEARRVAHTKKLSDEGAKQLKYGTRALWPFLGDEDD